MRLNQAFGNLLSNGVEFTRREGSVTIGTHQGILAQEVPARVVTVCDTGIGISPEDLDQVDRVVLPLAPIAGPASPLRRCRAADHEGDH